MSEAKTPENVLFQMLKNGWSCDYSGFDFAYLKRNKFSYGFHWEKLTHELLLDINYKYGRFIETPPEPLDLSPWMIAGRWEWFKKSEYFEAIKRADFFGLTLSLIVDQIDKAVERAMNEEPKN